MTKQELLEKYSKPICLLDHGFLRLVDIMGDDSAIVQMARVSYGEGTKKVSTDRSLIRYLMRHKHTSPFEGCEIKIHCKLPIFIARQWVRHRTANINEISARYSILPDETYLPELTRIQTQSSTNKQGSGDPLDSKTAEAMQFIMEESMKYGRVAYEAALNHNVTRELARITLPVSAYTEWYWKIDLHNLLHFIHLRADSHAQYEIQVYANALSEIVKEWVPLTWEAYEDYRIQSLTFSQSEKKGITAALKGIPEETFIQEALKESRLKGREKMEFKNKLKALLIR